MKNAFLDQYHSVKSMKMFQVNNNVNNAYPNSDLALINSIAFMEIQKIVQFMKTNKKHHVIHVRKITFLNIKLIMHKIFVFKKQKNKTVKLIQNQFQQILHKKYNVKYVNQGIIFQQIRMISIRLYAILIKKYLIV